MLTPEVVDEPAAASLAHGQHDLDTVARENTYGGVENRRTDYRRHAAGDQRHAFPPLANRGKYL